MFWVAVSWKQTHFCSLRAIAGNITWICSALEIDNSNDWAAWKYLDNSGLLCSSPAHMGENIPSKKSKDFSWLISKHQLHKHRINSKEKQLSLLWALQQTMIKLECELHFSTGTLLINWYGASWVYNLEETSSTQVYIASQSCYACDYCPEVQGLVQSIFWVSCCSCVFITEGLTHISHTFKSQLVFAQPLTEKETVLLLKTS